MEINSPAKPTLVPTYEALQEFRFAVVIYGGVSLAVYINGIVQELLRLVRATAPATSAGTAPLITDAKDFKASEKVYRKIGQIVGSLSESPAEIYGRVKGGAVEPIRTRFLVDVLSGTSAGGINAIFLAKALANNAASLDALERMWIKEGDIDSLINDRQSRKDTERLAPQDPPESLLNSERMYLKLLDALDEMPSDGSSPLVDKLDLFSTTTDISGLTLPIALTDKVVDERRHRNVFHFQYSDTGDQNDFKIDDNPFLAFAARCTSAFPFAFQPMALCDIFPIVQTARSHRDKPYCDPNTDHWQHYYRDYIGRTGTTPAFDKRAFGDGGYLDNKPFSYAIETVFKRHSESQVSRKLVYIEPSPEEPRHPGNGERPDAIANSMAALVSLPRYETIRQDLEQILERNLQVQRIKSAIALIEKDLAAPRSGADPKQWLVTPHEQTQNRYGGSYSAYERLKITAVLDGLVAIVARALEIDPQSGYASAMRLLADAWLKSRYPEETQRRQFLLDFDVNYRLRRIRYVRQRIRAWFQEPEDRIDTSIRADYRAELAVIKARLKSPHDALQSLLDKPRHGSDFAAPNELIPENELKLIMRPPPAAEMQRGCWPGLDQYRHAYEASQRGCEDRAGYVFYYQQRSALLDNMAEFLKKEFVPVLQSASADAVASFADAALIDGAKQARADVRGIYEGFEAHDSAMFPIGYGSNLQGEDPIDVHRISPIDANARRQDVEVNGHKLKGQALGAFAAFLDETWRRNDILWGHLDGAQRLIEILVPGHDQAIVDLRKELIDEAHQEIVVDFLKLPDSDRPNWKLRLKEFFGGVRVAPEPTLVARASARATAVTGALLGDISEKRGVNRKPFAAAALAGRIGWEFVEVSVPRTWRELFFVYWLQLLMLFALLLTVIGVLTPSGPWPTGVLVLVFLVVAYIARMLLRRYLGGRTVLTAATLAAGSAAACLVLAVVLANVKILLPHVYATGIAIAGAAERWVKGAEFSWTELVASMWYLSVTSAAVTVFTLAWAAHIAGKVKSPEGGPARPVRALARARTWDQVKAVLGGRAHEARKQMQNAIQWHYPLIASYVLLFVSLGAALGLAGNFAGWLIAVSGLLAGIADVWKNVAMLRFVNLNIPDPFDGSLRLSRGPRVPSITNRTSLAISLGVVIVLSARVIGLFASRLFH